MLRTLLIILSYPVLIIFFCTTIPAVIESSQKLIQEKSFYSDLKKGKQFFDQTKYSLAIPHYLKCLNYLKQNEENDYIQLVYLYLGKSFFNDRQFLKAIDAYQSLQKMAHIKKFKKIKEIKKFQKEAFYRILESELELSNLEKVRLILTKKKIAYGNKQDKNELWFKLGKAYLKQGIVTKASKTLNTLLWEIKDPAFYKKVKTFLVKNNILSPSSKFSGRKKLPKLTRFYARNKDRKGILSIYQALNTPQKKNRIQKIEIETAKHIANYYFKERNYSKAAPTYKFLYSLVRKSSQKAYALYQTARSYNRSGKSEQGKYYFKKAINNHPKTKYGRNATFELALEYLREGDFATADKYFNLSGRRSSSKWYSAWNSLLNRDLNKALSKFNNISKQYPTRHLGKKASYWKARTLWSLKKKEEAKVIFQNIRDKSPHGYYGLMAHKWLNNINESNSVEDQPEDTIAYRKIQEPEILSEVYPPVNELDKKITLIELGYKTEANILMQNDFYQYAKNDNYIPAFTYLFSKVNNYRTPYKAVLKYHKEKLPLTTTQKSILIQAFYPQAFRSQVEKNARKHDIDMAFIWSIMRAESGFRPQVVSPAGAIGLMQIMPKTGKRLADLTKLIDFDTTYLSQPTTNIKLGTYYLRQLLDLFDGNYILATAAYNAGEERVLNWINQGPDLYIDQFIENIPFRETRNYVKKVMVNFFHYRKIYKSESKLAHIPLPQFTYYASNDTYLKDRN